MDDDYDYSPDDDGDSLGAYNNMERAETRPDFLANTISSTAKDIFRANEDSASGDTESSGDTPTTQQAGGIFDKDKFQRNFPKKQAKKPSKLVSMPPLAVLAVPPWTLLKKPVKPPMR